MSWFLIALLGYFILAGVSVSDKFILSKKLATPAVFVFYSTVPLLILFFSLFFKVAILSGVGLFWAAISGLSLLFGFWTMYKGFLASEVSHAGPLLGAVMPIFVLIVSYFFLGEVLSDKQLAACFLLICGSFLISFEKSVQYNGWHRGFAWIILAGFLFAVSHVAAKYLYDIYGFTAGLVWSRGMSGIFGLALIFLPSVRTEIQSWFEKKEKDLSQQNKNKLSLIVFNKTFGLVGVFLVQLAVALGSVTIVNAMAGAQFGLLIILVAGLSIFYPKIFKEEYSKLEIVQEIIAVVVIGVGLGMLI